VLFGCEVESVDYPPEPQIEYLNTEVSTSKNILDQTQIGIKVTFYVIDGDGDIGLTQNDIYPPYDANFFPVFYGIKDGVMNIDTNFVADRYRIPYVGNLGQDNTLKARVSVDFEYPYNDIFPFIYDSVVYSFYIQDRALNKSNIAWTDTIVINF
jgi:hypothetical protein